MNDDRYVHVLVIETGKGVQVASFNPNEWKKLSPTFRQDWLNVGGIDIKYKYQSWIPESVVSRAVLDWAGENYGVPF